MIAHTLCNPSLASTASVESANSANAATIFLVCDRRSTTGHDGYECHGCQQHAEGLQP
jgi:hypothetical protein